MSNPGLHLINSMNKAGCTLKSAVISFDSNRVQLPYGDTLLPQRSYISVEYHAIRVPLSIIGNNGEIGIGVRKCCLIGDDDGGAGRDSVVKPLGKKRGDPQTPAKLFRGRGGAI